jgi:hypothetical protein
VDIPNSRFAFFISCHHDSVDKNNIECHDEANVIGPLMAALFIIVSSLVAEDRR